MSRRMSRKLTRKTHGGFLDSWGNSLSNWWGKRNATPSSPSSYSAPSYPPASYSAPTPSYSSSSYPPASYSAPEPSQSYSAPAPASPSYSSYSYGGRRSRRGGFKDNLPLTGLAATASPISGIRTPHVKTWVGGRKTKRRHHVHTKRCRHRRTRR